MRDKKNAAQFSLGGITGEPGFFIAAGSAYRG